LNSHTSIAAIPQDECFSNIDIPDEDIVMDYDNDSVSDDVVNSISCKTGISMQEPIIIDDSPPISPLKEEKLSELKNPSSRVFINDISSSSPIKPLSVKDQTPLKSFNSPLKTLKSPFKENSIMDSPSRRIATQKSVLLDDDGIAVPILISDDEDDELLSGPASWKQ